MSLYTTMHSTWMLVTGIFLVIAIVSIQVLKRSQGLRKKLFGQITVSTETILMVLILLATASIILFLVFIFLNRRGI